ncbi:MAG: peptide chain release factor 1 [Clostridia bacterium]|nr:peptide chain release factor 1 [Clostridia bacterium]
MTSKLETIYQRYLKLNDLVGDPEVIKNIDEWRKYTKELSEMEEVIDKYKEYKKVLEEKTDAEKSILTETDSEMKALLSDEIQALKEKLTEITSELKILLIPKDENDDKNVIIEIRAGAGGEEAALFAYELYRMYVNYADKNRFKTEEIDSNETELGGIKEVTFSVVGKGAYAKLKYESGVHRVQRVPETESQGRIQTSTATVAVLPEVEDIEIKIDEKDLKVDTYRSSGAGGQHVNKTESCIRMTHIPTGIVVTCQDERSQIKNREKALKVLKSRLYDHYNSEYRKEYDENRKSQIGTGDRSERIRTYNFPQGRITDHRIGFTLYSLENFLSGDIGEMIEALAIADREAKLSNQEED